MAQAKKGDTVRVHYTGKLEDGTVFDSSQDSEPLEFEIGSGQIISGFEQAVVGMDEGESKTAKVAAAEAYGDRRDEMVMEVDREQFPGDEEPEVGQRFEIGLNDGRRIAVTVTDTSGDTVELDANHPLAGQDLVFDIELVGIV